jgi:hypothetical protein
LISENLPALQVIIPLLAAPLAFLLRKPRLVWPFAMLTTILTLLVRAHPGVLNTGWMPPMPSSR